MVKVRLAIGALLLVLFSGPVPAGWFITNTLEITRTYDEGAVGAGPAGWPSSVAIAKRAGTGVLDGYYLNNGELVFADRGVFTQTAGDLSHGFAGAGSNSVFAFCGAPDGLYAGLFDGTGWQAVSITAEANCFGPSITAANGGATLYAAAVFTDTLRVYESLDAGHTWTPTHQVPGVDLQLTPLVVGDPASDRFFLIYEAGGTMWVYDESGAITGTQPVGSRGGGNSQLAAMVVPEAYRPDGFLLQWVYQNGSNALLRGMFSPGVEGGGMVVTDTITALTQTNVALGIGLWHFGLTYPSGCIGAVGSSWCYQQGTWPPTLEASYQISDTLSYDGGRAIGKGSLLFNLRGPAGGGAAAIPTLGEWSLLLLALLLVGLGYRSVRERGLSGNS